MTPHLPVIHSRRSFMLAAAGTGAAVATAGWPASAEAAVSATSAASPIRPPAVPLAVRGPYLSSWLPGTTLPGTWAQFWNGRRTQLAGLVRVDGVCYEFAGKPRASGGALSQSLLEVTATRSRFSLAGGGIELAAEFLSPAEPGQPQAQSVPLSYVLVTVASADGNAHDVQLYLDISGEWAGGFDSDVIEWAPAQLTAPDGGLRAWTVSLRTQEPLGEHDQLAAWGRVVWATRDGAGVSVQSGAAATVRGQFASQGQLTNDNDTDYRAVSDGWPVFAFASDLGSVTTTAVTVPLFLGQVRTPAIRYLGRELQPRWKAHFSGWQELLSFFSTDLAAASSRADHLDATVRADATAAGGTDYAGLCALSLRQAYGGTELVTGPGGTPWAFLKEISSDGNVSTVDVVYPSSPVWLYADPDYLGYLLEPLLAYAESGRWPKKYAEHDLGTRYPDAAGHNNGVEENMPIEESGNLLIMTAAYCRRRPEAAAGFARAHYAICQKWADYLVGVLPNPGYQNQTDDFAGKIAHSVNLALKGIIAIAAMSQIAEAAGHHADRARYRRIAHRYISYWLAHARDSDRRHLDLTYHSYGTWGTLYNGYADRLLGTGLIPKQTAKLEAAWYSRQLRPLGLPLQTPHRYAKTDWQLFTAAWLSDYAIKDKLIRRVWTYASTTPDRVPFSDLYDTVNGTRVMFRARPVQGGIFALLALR